MNASEYKKDDGAVGKGITTVDVPPNAAFRIYTVDRPAPGRLKAVEMVLDVTIMLAHPVKKVWPIFKDFNLWMNRFGYFWEGVPADNENDIVILINKGSNDYKYGRDRPKYVVRKVVSEQLIYFDALPSPLVGLEGAWTGHTLVNLSEERGKTKILFFMEHTFYSETASIEELRAEVKGSLDSGSGFWRDQFIPDLTSAVESRLGAST